GGSVDDTLLVALQLGCRVFPGPADQGGQMRLGTANAIADVVMLLHSATWLPPKACHAALNCLRDTTVVAGCFWKISRYSPLLLPGSLCKCALRLLLGRRI